MHPLGTEWDAPIVGSTWQVPPIPGADIFDLRSAAARTAALNTPQSAGALDDEPFVGSNSWAVAGTHAQDKAALLANDMHLSLRLPHIWYRARLIVGAGTEAPRDLVGVTLPGLPMLMAGSNGRIAWGYTNSYGDFSDVVIVETDPQNSENYLTESGSEPFENRDETIVSPRRQPGVPRRAGDALGTDHRLRRRRSAARAQRGRRTIRAPPTCACSTSRRRLTSRKP